MKGHKHLSALDQFHSRNNRNVCVCYLVDVDERLFILNQHLSELKALIRTGSHHTPQQRHPVWRISHLPRKQHVNHSRAETQMRAEQSLWRERRYLLSIEHYLLELSRLSKALDDFSRNIGSQVNTEGQRDVSRLHQITQLLRALQLQGIMGKRSLTRGQCNTQESLSVLLLLTNTSITYWTVLGNWNKAEKKYI